MSNHTNNGASSTSSSSLSSWFRFGLPLGSAMIMVACWDTISYIFPLWLDVSEIFLYYEMGHYPHFDTLIITWLIVELIWITSNLVLLWFGFILMGKLLCLKAWIATNLICPIIYLITYIYITIEDLEGWFVENSPSDIYMLVTFLIINLYANCIAIQYICSTKSSTTTTTGSERIAQDPIIGKGLRHIFKYFKENPILAAKFLLISELMIIAEYVFTRQIVLALIGREVGRGHEGEEGDSVALIVEEYVFRGIRFLVSSVGLYIVVKDKLWLLKIWGLCYFGLIISSLIIFIYLLFTWSSTLALYTIGYFVMFCLNLAYRCGILFVVLKAATPYMSTATSFVVLNES